MLREVWGRRGSSRRRPRRFRAFGIGVVVALLSIVTCSAGVTIPDLTSDFGQPITATTDAANRVIERALSSMQRASSTRRFRLSVSEAEATSIVALGLMLPELLEAANRVPPETVRKARTIDEMRAMLQAGRDSANASASLGMRVTEWLNPHLRTSEAQLRFTPGGEIVMATNVHAWSFRLPMLFVVKPRASPGELEFAFVKGRVGRVGVPKWAFNASGRLLAAALLKGRGYAEISQLSVASQQLTLEVAVHERR